MNFDKDYDEFIEALQKKHTPLDSSVLSRVERVAVSLFVSYLNQKYTEERKKAGENV